MSGDAFFRKGQSFTQLSLDETDWHARYGSPYISLSSNLYCQYRDLAEFSMLEYFRSLWPVILPLFGLGETLDFMMLA